LKNLTVPCIVRVLPRGADRQSIRLARSGSEEGRERFLARNHHSATGSLADIGQVAQKGKFPNSFNDFRALPRKSSSRIGGPSCRIRHDRGFQPPAEQRGALDAHANQPDAAVGQRLDRGHADRSVGALLAGFGFGHLKIDGSAHGRESFRGRKRERGSSLSVTAMAYGQCLA